MPKKDRSLENLIINILNWKKNIKTSKSDLAILILIYICRRRNLLDLTLVNSQEFKPLSLEACP